MSVFKKAIVGSAYLTLSNYVVYFFAIAVQLLLARWLLPSDFGFFAVVMASVEILYVLMSVDLAMACLQSDRSNRFQTALGATYIYLFGLLLLAYPLFKSMEYWRDTQTAYYFVILLFARCFSNLSTVYAAYLEKDLLMGKLAITRALCRIVSLIGGLYLAKQGYGVASLLAIEVLNALLNTLSALYISPLKFQSNQWKTSDLRPLFSFAFAQYMFRVTAVMLYKAPVMIVEVLTGNKHLVGLLDRSLYVAGLPNAVTSSFHSKVAFILFKNVKQESIVFDQYLEMVLWFFVRLLTPAVLALILFPIEIVSLILGPQWIEAAPMLAGLGVYAGCMVIYNILNQVCMSLNVLRYVSQTQIVMLVMLVLSGWLLYYKDFSWSWLAITLSLLFILSTMFLKIKLKKHNININTVKIFLMPFITCLIFFGIHNSWHFESWQIEILFFLTVYILLSALFDQSMWSIVRKKLITSYRK